MHDNAGAGAQVLGDAGINVQLMQEINMEINPDGQNNNMVVDQAPDNDGLDNAEQMELDVAENWVPQHPDQPQDTVTFDQSGSTANYLRATGPVTYLNVDAILAAIQSGDILAAVQNGADSSASDDSGIVSSARTTTVIVPTFIIRACQKLPVEYLQLVTLKTPMIEWKEDTQRAIVPVQPVMGSILIRLWAHMFGEAVAVIQSHAVDGPLSPLAIVSAAQCQVVVGPLSIPTAVSRKPGSKTPLVDTRVRRSSHLNPDVVDGVQVKEEGDTYHQP
jgi:hypothetical protein